MFALYRVINNIPDFVNLVREPYKVVADAILPNTGVISDIVANFENLKLTTIDEVINSLATFNTSQWDLLLSKGLGETVNAAIESIIRVNNFFGLSITNTPSWKSISVIIPLLAMSLQFVQSKQISVKPDKKDNTPNPMASMNVIMPIMSGFFCLMLPIGVGLYWIANSLFSIIQQFFVNKHLDSMDIDELVEKSQEKAMSKLTKKSSTGGASIQELAKKQTKSIESVSDRIKDSSKNNTNDDKVDIDNDTEKDSYNPTSISEIANLLKNRNSEKGDK
jgi:YidC/Oxa1 family membrane protein insertase